MFALFLHDMWKILLYSLLLGAGLPVLYAVGVRASALGAVGADGSESAASAVAVRRRQVVGKAVAGVCFAVVMAGIGLGLAYIWASGHGEQLSFEHGFPTFVPKS